MKTILHKILILALLLPAVGLAATPKGKYTREKKINKSYAVNGNAGLTLANKYGSVYITTWNENKTEIDVTITVSGDNEDDVIKRLSGIDVDFEAGNSLVVAKTRIDNFRGKRTSMEINYTVKIPKNGTLGVNNQYGTIKLGKIYGAVNLSCQYGGITIDELNGDSNSLKTQYCDNSKITFVKNADMSIQYSDVVISKANTLNLSTQYGDISIGTVSSLTYKSQYGDLSVKVADKINGGGNYSDISVGYVDNSLNISCNYGDIHVAKLGKDLKSVSINSTYGDVLLKYDDAVAFDFELSGAYADINGLSGLKISEKIEKSSLSSYKGYHKNSGGARIYVKTMYGDVTLAKSL
ncbi:hypothetical protein GR160_01345 [Flavobacterium sp. Sd200]|uniref:DUF4097 family beta strand repeat-containing protein n=1 Tax=Flavobacterium sp. Sd200 TaxID=2692211 RepID=UPI001368DAE8|nr:DUF4097 family beta strand repeat-containing protein [Flavobacterium sp. Sd200]MXN89858.1 hypothetical protein [Flavobacterium sp. Sd200]